MKSAPPGSLAFRSGQPWLSKGTWARRVQGIKSNWTERGGASFEGPWLSEGDMVYNGDIIFMMNNLPHINSLRPITGTIFLASDGSIRKHRMMHGTTKWEVYEQAVPVLFDLLSVRDHLDKPEESSRVERKEPGKSLPAIAPPKLPRVVKRGKTPRRDLPVSGVKPLSKKKGWPW
jgi:hypothetical protein